jgi:hypothetical protein
MLIEYRAFELSTGRTIYLNEMLISYTYSGKLEGSISIRGNQKVLEYLKTRGMRLWSSKPSVILQLDQRLSDIAQELPRFTFASLFWSAPVRAKEKTASELVLIWLAPDIEPIFTENIVYQIQRLNWDDHAQDFLLMG